jgi:predicted dinucleotide-binding enzyme
VFAHSSSSQLGLTVKVPRCAAADAAAKRVAAELAQVIGREKVCCLGLARAHEVAHSERLPERCWSLARGWEAERGAADYTEDWELLEIFACH